MVLEHLSLVWSNLETFELLFELQPFKDQKLF